MKNIFKNIILSSILITPTLCGCASQDKDIDTTLFTTSVNEYQYYHGTKYKEIDVSQLPYSINVNIIKQVELLILMFIKMKIRIIIFIKEEIFRLLLFK